MGETNAFFHQIKSQMIIKYFFTECKTVKGNNCIFPFKYKGKSYSSCTKVESANGAGWCATEVDSAGQVVRNRWEDCGLGCQEDTAIPCTNDDLFNVAGRCISNTSAVSLERKLVRSAIPVQLDFEPSGQQSAPICDKSTIRFT